MRILLAHWELLHHQVLQLAIFAMLVDSTMAQQLIALCVLLESTRRTPGRLIVTTVPNILFQLSLVHLLVLFVHK
jgi:hypothetical protein